MGDDHHVTSAGAFVLGSLDPAEEEAFRRHADGCEVCLAAIGEHAEILARLAQGSPESPPRAELRDLLMDITEAPALPLQRDRYQWDDLAPGIKAAKIKEDSSRGVEAWLVWAAPGARHGLHRHRGEEHILVLQGRLKDHRGTYGPGELCHSRAGSVHAEEALPGEDCICYVVSQQGFERLE
jgi:anti-sigma factor ChrR (cupin superfamily)